MLKQNEVDINQKLFPMVNPISIHHIDTPNDSLYLGPFGGSVANVDIGLGSRGQPQAARGTENHLECRHSSSCHAAFLPGIGLSATTGAMILAT